MTIGRWITMSAVMTALLAGGGCGPQKQVRPEVADLEGYIRQAQSRQSESRYAPGSLFNQAGPTRDLFSDNRARYIDDIVTIVVAESTNALSSADASTSNASDASNSITNLAGLEGKLTSLPNLVNATGSKNFKGSGATNRKTTLSTTVTGRVFEVLPNGYLAIEGTKEIVINNEKQTVILTGVVRPQDLTSSNQVSSTAVANLQVHLVGKGQVAKSIQPGWLFRILQGILPF